MAIRDNQEMVFFLADKDALKALAFLSKKKRISRSTLLRKFLHDGIQRLAGEGDKPKKLN
jgi:hypothetical protein